MSPETIEASILRLTEKRGPSKSICPSEVAKDIEPDNWNRHMRAVRAASVGLARAGRIVILRKGKPVDPDDFRGVYRLAAPPADE
ncbi:DUF3253 domain-containing protein [Hyphobacterium sp. SN044]|uniref:DUF3253 domain-containing protein n=1 Tax=Hyphobacterium sp. SN044 TaxID=2912575 RepID=UPI001F4789D0|nr:DUF3253 domain-containing protein [Hyphobacterium sp. SN044]MCF8879302.1 DUF3253 domain-containing protein [Hyphobacterium sp. SN044]